MVMTTEPRAPRTGALDIRGLTPNSLNEWEGRIAAIVFFGGCNWRCPFCHAGALVNRDASLPAIDPAEVFDLVLREQGWLDGIVLSGGEPTLQPGLVDFVRDLGATGVAVRMQTNGSRPEVVEALLKENLLASLVLDYKAPLDERLETVTRVSAEATRLEGVRRTFALAAESGIEREYRTTLCPAVIDEATLTAMAEALEPEGVWSLQQYETADVLDPDAAGARRYEEDELEAMAAIARRHHEHVILRKGRNT